MDESCDAALIVGLRDDGHDVLAACESFPGRTDDRIVETARREDRIIVTEDRDFGGLVIAQAQPCPGVVYLRMMEAPGSAKLARIRDILVEFGQRLEGLLVVVTDDRVRSRPLPIAT